MLKGTALTLKQTEQVMLQMPVSQTTDLPLASILTNPYHLYKRESCSLLTLGMVGQRRVWANQQF